MLSFQTNGFHNYAAKFSSFHENLIAVGACQHYGIVGNGKLFILSSSTEQPLRNLTLHRDFDTKDAIFDLCWSEVNPRQILTACGDGSILMFDLSSKDRLPIDSFQGHQQESSSVDWNLLSKISFVSGGYDGKVSVWAPFSSTRLIGNFVEHNGPVYSVKWSPYFDRSFLSCSGDGTVKLWDLSMGPQSALTVRASQGEVLSLDFNKYNRNTFITAGASNDPTVRLWDMRKTNEPIRDFKSHRFGIRRAIFSPHSEHIFLSTGYDMTIKLWNIDHPLPVFSYEHHTEFVFAIDFSLFTPSTIVSAGWDSKVCIFNSQF